MDERKIEFAKGVSNLGALLTLVSGIGLGILIRVGVVERFSPTLFAVVFVPLTLGMFYQAQFILRHPRTAIEHDVRPPSKYDIDYDSKLGARIVGFLTGLAGLLGVGLIVYLVAFLP